MEQEWTTGTSLQQSPKYFETYCTRATLLLHCATLLFLIVHCVTLTLWYTYIVMHLQCYDTICANLTHKLNSNLETLTQIKCFSLRNNNKAYKAGKYLTHQYKIVCVKYMYI